MERWLGYVTEPVTQVGRDSWGGELSCTSLLPLSLCPALYHSSPCVQQALPSTSQELEFYNMPLAILISLHVRSPIMNYSTV
jgi:hypothetical protein